MASSTWIPQHHRNITLGRLSGYVSRDLFADVNFLSRLYFRNICDCSLLEVYSVPPGQPFPTYEEAITANFRPWKIGDTFGPSWSTHWFHIRLRVPDGWGDNKEEAGAPLWFVWDSGSEAMVYVDGIPRQGLTDARNEFVLAPGGTWKSGQQFELYVEMAACRVGGNGNGIQAPDENLFFRLNTVGLGLPDPLAWQLLYDFQSLSDLANTLPADSAAAADALLAANRMINLYQRDNRSSWVEACKVAADFRKLGTASGRHEVFAVGHCHIDTAWLWPFSETHRKTARSWSSQLALMEQYPEHTFTASSAQQYKWLKEDYPQLFQKIVDASRKGRFLPVGGTWVEMDCNLPSGESLVRQFLYGQAFFKQEFGARSDVFWLPDTFGYPAQLPAIVAGCGMHYFLTQKLSWNNINPFPHNTFYWQALDGSRVLTHFPPANTYCSQVSVSDVMMTVTNNKDKDRAPVSLLLFGNGDGGGGPTREMLERLRRLENVDGLPSKLAMSTPHKFFETLESSSHDLLTWRGELYFELHRGTYTSHAANKRYNRKCELLMREVEMLSALTVAMASARSYEEAKAITHDGRAARASPSATDTFAYPKDEINAMWEDMLLFQFHDVLPGSAINAVYKHSLGRYEEIHSQLSELQDTALGALCGTLKRGFTRSSAAGTDQESAVSAAADDRGREDALVRSGRFSAADPGHERITAQEATTRGHEEADLTSARSSVTKAAEAKSTTTEPAATSRSHEEAATTSASQSPASLTEDCVSEGTGNEPLALVFNSLCWARREVVEVPLEWLPSGAKPVQISGDGTCALFDVTCAPVSPSPVTSPPPATNQPSVELSHMKSEGISHRAPLAHPIDLSGSEGTSLGPPQSSHSATGNDPKIQRNIDDSTESNSGDSDIDRGSDGCSSSSSSQSNSGSGDDNSSCSDDDRGFISFLNKLKSPRKHRPGKPTVATSTTVSEQLPGSCNAASTPVTEQLSASCTVASSQQHCATAVCSTSAEQPTIYILSNQFVRVVLDEHGQLVSLLDRVMQRELVPCGALGNRLVLYEDVPLFWDAWDAEIYHLEKPLPLSLGTVSITEQGPLRVALKVTHPLTANASAVMTISLTALSPRVDFSLEVDWHEEHKFLKVEFPWDISSDHATYEVQFGAVTRPTHTNTSWDWAKFEVCGHRWADLSEPDYGVALLNDCKYGYATHGNVMRLSLLRSPKAPDPETDMGKHTIRYAVFPHIHTWQAGHVVGAAAAFNSPLLLSRPTASPHASLPLEPLLQVTAASPQAIGGVPLVLDTVKLSEASSPGGKLELLVRLYEPHGMRGTARLEWHPLLPVMYCRTTNLLEDDLKLADLWCRDRDAGQQDTRSSVELRFTPFQILSLLLIISGPQQPLTSARCLLRSSTRSTESDYEIVS